MSNLQIVSDQVPYKGIKLTDRSFTHLELRNEIAHISVKFPQGMHVRFATPEEFSKMMENTDPQKLEELVGQNFWVYNNKGWAYIARPERKNDKVVMGKLVEDWTQSTKARIAYIEETFLREKRE